MFGEIRNLDSSRTKESPIILAKADIMNQPQTSLGIIIIKRSDSSPHYSTKSNYHVFSVPLKFADSCQILDQTNVCARTFAKSLHFSQSCRQAGFFRKGYASSHVLGDDEATLTLPNPEIMPSHKIS